MDNRKIDTVILDFDSCMYPYGCGIDNQMNKRVASFYSDKFNISYEKAMKLQTYQYQTYGTNTAAIIKTKKDVNLASFLLDMHNVDMSVVKPDKRLAFNIEKLKDKGKSVFIFSNAMRDPYIPKMLDRMQVPLDLFDGITGTEDLFYFSKPNRVAFDLFLNKFNVNPYTSLMVEDSESNLRTAKEYGMSTMLVHYPETKHKNKSIDNMSFIDYTCSNINYGLEFIINDRSQNANSQLHNRFVSRVRG